MTPSEIETQANQLVDFLRKHKGDLVGVVKQWGDSKQLQPSDALKIFTRALEIWRDKRAAQ